MYIQIWKRNKTSFCRRFYNAFIIFRFVINNNLKYEKTTTTATNIPKNLYHLFPTCTWFEAEEDKISNLYKYDNRKQNKTKQKSKLDGKNERTTTNRC